MSVRLFKSRLRLQIQYINEIKHRQLSYIGPHLCVSPYLQQGSPYGRVKKKKNITNMNFQLQTVTELILQMGTNNGLR